VPRAPCIGTSWPRWPSSNSRRSRRQHSG
jgi:hypothetical protein